jgi:hypothetical protein
MLIPIESGLYILNATLKLLCPEVKEMSKSSEEILLKDKRISFHWKVP